MKKISKIRLMGDRYPRVGVPGLKVSKYLPIKSARNVFATPCKEVRIMEVAGFEVQGSNMADQIKSIRKVRLQREVLENPEMARELVKVEATGTYNARGDVVQAVSTDLGDA
ncbi:hypothetical protein [Pseudodesulfovibrio indicus]|uniref:hypothetical protein n=1 Tax=Pseudodesulfovibrio indicus TaxID=1716143 RepID=UPI00292D12D2|nr:hypothetical protein [Pseudodesulfovibrio indicus]